MTGFTSCRNPQCAMIRIDRIVVIGLVTTNTGGGGIVVIPARVTAVAINRCMRAGQQIIIIMNGKGRRAPAGIGRMTFIAGGRKAKRNVIGIGGIVVIGLVTSYTRGGGIVVIAARVTAVAINRCMAAGQRIIIIMNGKGSRAPAGTGRMTFIAGGRKSKRNVIWVGGIVVIGLVTTHAGGGGIVVIPARVTAVAIGRSMGSS